MFNYNNFKIVDGGTVQAGRGIYLTRRADEELLVLCRTRAFVYVLSSRQVGKSSLMVRTAETLKDENISSVIIDISAFGTIVTAEQWYLAFLKAVQRQLNLEIKVNDWWNAHGNLPMAARLILFFREIVLARIVDPIVIFVDEIDTTRGLGFTDDFFAAIRSIYNDRASVPHFQRLSFVLIGVATPNDLISDPARTPFNIGIGLELTDFTYAEALPLADKLGVPSHVGQKVLRSVLKWTGGHPYLTMRFCKEILIQNEGQEKPIVTTEEAVDELAYTIFIRSASDRNLQFVRDMLTRRSPDIEGVLTTYREIYRNKKLILDEERSLIKSHLKLAGVVRREGERLVVRNTIYKEAFNDRWIAEHLPVNWTRRLTRATAALVLALLVLCAPLAVYALAKKAEAETLLAQAMTSAAAERKAREQAEQAAERERQARSEAEAQRERAENAAAKERHAKEAAEEQRKLAEQLRARADEKSSQALAAAVSEMKARAEAEANQKRVEELAEKVKEQAQVAKSRELAATAISNLNVNPELSVLLAVEASKVSNTTQAQDALRTALPSLSNSVASLRGHSGPIYKVAFSPDSNMVATAGEDKVVRVWNVRTGELIVGLSGHTESVTSVLFSHDGKYLLTLSNDHTARLWSSDSWRLLRILKGEDGSTTGGFSPNDRYVVTAGVNDFATVWDVGTGKIISTLRDLRATEKESLYDLTSASFSPDGKQIVTASEDGAPRIWDAQSGKLLSTLKGHSGAVLDAAFNVNGQLVVTAGVDATARVWSVNYHQPPKVLDGHKGEVLTANFSPDGRLIVTASVDNTARVWNADSGELIAELRGHTSAVLNAVFSPDSKSVVTASFDNTARVWEAATGRELFSLRGHSERVRDAAFSPDAKFIITASDDSTARLWENNSSRQSLQLSGHVDTVTKASLSADGLLALTASKDGTARIWDAKSGRIVSLLRGQSGALTDARFSPSGDLVVTASEDSIDNTVWIWESRSGKVVRKLSGHRDEVVSAAFSPDGRYILTASVDGTARLWQTSTGEEDKFRLIQDGASFLGAEFNPNGKLILAVVKSQVKKWSDPGEGTVQLWDLETNTMKYKRILGTATSFSAAFNSDGTSFVVTNGDGGVTVYDTNTGSELLRLKTSPSEKISRAAFSPDKKFIVTLGTSTRIWDSQSGESIAEVRGHTGPVVSAEFSRDGNFLITGSADATARIVPREMFAPFSELVTIASRKVTRQLSEAEKIQYLQ